MSTISADYKEDDKYWGIYWIIPDTSRCVRAKGPCIVMDSGEVHFAQSTASVYHRDNGPAYIVPNGEVWYMQHGIFHRESSPALITSDGVKEYFIKGNKIEPFDFFLKYGEL